MTVHFHRQIDKLKDMILQLGQLVERAVVDSIRAVEERNEGLARQVIDRDTEIDEMEVDIEEECLHALALHQPVAYDLRFVVAVLKINNDLERIADHAVNVAEQAKYLADEPVLEVVPYDLAGMTRRVKKMLGKALKALIDNDPDLADEVRSDDDEVDEIHSQMYSQVELAIISHPESVYQYIGLMNLSRHLERIADLTVNISEDVIYMCRGEIQRHRPARPVRRSTDV
ncbi:MAG: phosphate signaling complex protein PhoU [Phycisphaera sp.]|nr:phosphate signaling complex protein PhoU [Phycisphaera sp.]